MGHIVTYTRRSKHISERKSVENNFTKSNSFVNHGSKGDKRNSQNEVFFSLKDLDKAESQI